MGLTRSKLESWLVENLAAKFPTLEIIPNDRKTIGMELDIWIPKLRLAIEVNGIFHYAPIFGTTKLGKTQTNDIKKQLLCAEAGISLCVLNTSSMGRFSIAEAMPFLDIICTIIQLEDDRQG